MRNIRESAVDIPSEGLFIGYTTMFKLEGDLQSIVELTEFRSLARSFLYHKLHEKIIFGRIFEVTEHLHRFNPIPNFGDTQILQLPTKVRLSGRKVQTTKKSDNPRKEKKPSWISRQISKARNFLSFMSKSKAKNSHK